MSLSASVVHNAPPSVSLMSILLRSTFRVNPHPSPLSSHLLSLPRIIQVTRSLEGGRWKTPYRKPEGPLLLLGEPALGDTLVLDPGKVPSTFLKFINCPNSGRQTGQMTSSREGQDTGRVNPPPSPAGGGGMGRKYSPPPLRPF